MATDRVVLCGGAAGGDLPFPDARPLKLDRPNSAGGNVRLRIEDVRRAMVGDVPPEFLDLLEIAVYVYVADQAVKRGTANAVDLGDSWHRRLFFRVPVRAPEFWNSTSVRDALTHLLAFVADDEYLFEFVPREVDAGGIQPYLKFEDIPYSGEIDEVMLFSGGLDSLAGAVDEAVTRGRRVLLVHHRSHEKGAKRHAALLRELGDAAVHRPFHLTVHANKVEELSDEYTQRTRSFLYGSLGATAAAMVRRRRLSIYENGVTSLNLPLQDQVVGARASRTTHPQTLRFMSRLFSLVAGGPFEVVSPFQWRTKADIVRVIADAEQGKLIGLSSSCSHTHTWTNTRTHCGVCSQCIDRRFGVLAAGAESQDPADKYGTELLTGSWSEPIDRLLLTGYVDLARRIDRMGQAEFFAAFGEASRALRHYGVRAGEAAARMHELHKRHAKGVCRVIEDAIRDNAAAVVRGVVPADSLVQMVFTSAPEPTRTDEPSAAENVFHRCGKGWQLRYKGGELLNMPAERGLAYLHILVSNPQRCHRVGELASMIDRDRPRYGLSAPAERIDKEAVQNYRVRIGELEEDLQEAVERQDVSGQERIRTELELLTAEVRASVGQGGRIRCESQENERVRKAVQAAIRRAVKSIRVYDANFAEHFGSPVITCGQSPCYRPAPPVSWAT